MYMEIKDSEMINQPIYGCQLQWKKTTTFVDVNDIEMIIHYVYRRKWQWNEHPQLLWRSYTVKWSNTMYMEVNDSEMINPRYGGN